MYIIFLLIAAGLFVGFAVYTQYQITPIGDSVPKRVWGSVVAAVGLATTAFWQWLHGVTAP